MKANKVTPIEGETWAPIGITNGEYAASNLGRVKRLAGHSVDRRGCNRYRSERLVKPYHDKDGYLSCSIIVKGKPLPARVHRLVMLAFNPIPNYKEFQVNHINGVKDDNRLENLEWCTAHENIRHRVYELNVNPLIPVKAVRCVETGEVFPSLRAAVRSFGDINHGPLSQVLSPRHPTRQTYKGYHWKFVE